MSKQPAPFVYDDPRKNVEVDMKDPKSALFASIGCFMLKTMLNLEGETYRVIPAAANDDADGKGKGKGKEKEEERGKGKGKEKEKGPQTLEQFINTVAATTPKYGEGCHMVKEPPYVFRNDLCIGQSTGFYIDNGIVATAGHCVFHEVDGRQVLRDIEKLYFVFGFTKNSVERGIPWDKVFAIDRVLFGQNVDYEANSSDRKKIDVPDWALVRLKAAYSYLQRFPRALEIAVPVSKDQDQDNADLWCAGHPWGTTLKLMRPVTGIVKYSHPVQDVDKGKAIEDEPVKDKVAKDAAKDEAAEGKVSRRKPRKYRYNNICRTNCKLNPGNSGGPLFIGTKVIGIVASGLWPDAVATNGFTSSVSNPKILLPSEPPEKFPRYTNATKNELWYSLIRRDSRLFVMYAPVSKSQLTGTLELEIAVPNPHGELVGGFTEIPLDGGGRYLDGPDFMTRCAALPQNYLPCDINKIFLTYRSEGQGGSGSAGAHRTNPTLRMAIGFFNRCQGDIDYSQTGCIIYRADDIALRPGDRVELDLQPLLQGDMKTMLVTFT